MKFFDVAEKAGHVIKVVLEKICMVLFIAMTLIIWVHVFSRYILGHSLIWTEDVTKALMVYAAMFGAAILLQEDGHMSVSFISEKLKFEMWLKLMFLILTVVFSFWLVIYGQQYTVVGIRLVAPTTRLPFSYYYFAIPLGGFFLVILGVIRIMKQIRLIFLKAKNLGKREERSWELQQ